MSLLGKRPVRIIWCYVCDWQVAVNGEQEFGFLWGGDGRCPECQGYTDAVLGKVVISVEKPTCSP